VTKVLVLGAGKIGGAIVDLLAPTGDYELTVADKDAAFLDMVAPERVKRERIDVADMGAVDVSVSSLYRWRKRLEPRSRPPHRCRC